MGVDKELIQERADILAEELLAYHHKGVCGRAAKMLRRQADEITALHQILGYEGIEVGQDYLDECVAEIRKAR